MEEVGWSKTGVNCRKTFFSKKIEKLSKTKKEAKTRMKQLKQAGPASEIRYFFNERKVGSEFVQLNSKEKFYLLSVSFNQNFYILLDIFLISFEIQLSFWT